MYIAVYFADYNTRWETRVAGFRREVSFQDKKKLLWIRYLQISTCPVVQPLLARWFNIQKLSILLTDCTLHVIIRVYLPKQPNQHQKQRNGVSPGSTVDWKTKESWSPPRQGPRFFCCPQFSDWPCNPPCFLTPSSSKIAGRESRAPIWAYSRAL